MANLKYLSSALLTNIRTAEKLFVGGIHPKRGGGKKEVVGGQSVDLWCQGEIHDRIDCFWIDYFDS